MLRGSMNELELCPACGVPLIVNRNLYWEANGVIAVKASPRNRFVFFESDTIDQLLKGIEEMIGLRYVKSEWRRDRWNLDRQAFQRRLALRGLGNLASFEGDKNHVTIRIENTCLHLQMVGMAQALVELVYRIDNPDIEWNLADDGDLTITVRTKH